MKITKVSLLLSTLMFTVFCLAPVAQTKVSPAHWSVIRQALPLRGSFAADTDQFGIAIAVSDDTIVVGANWDDSSARGVNGNGADNSVHNSGAVYVFVRNGTNWVQQAYLKASNTEDNLPNGDSFGWSVAISGDTIVVGAMMENSGAVGINGDEFDSGGPNSGAAYVFVRQGTNWTQQAYLKASNSQAGDLFGHDVAISGDTIIVGARLEDGSPIDATAEPNDDITDSGAAYIFVREGGAWTQQAYLKASNADFSDQFGHSVDIHGDLAIVSARFEDSSANGINGDDQNNDAIESGAAYIFVRNGTNWTQQAYLKASNAETNDEFGMEVAICGETAVVGARFEDSPSVGVNRNQGNGFTDSGAAYVFVKVGEEWVQQAYLKASNTGPGDLFGRAVSIAGDAIVIGANWEDSSSIDGMNNSLGDSGAAYLFVRNGTNWTQQAFLKAANRAAGNRFGYSVAVAGRTIAVSTLAGSPQAYAFRGEPAQPRLTLTADPAGHSLSFAVQQGVTYRLERTALFPPIWEHVMTLDAAESKTFERHETDSSGEKAFYRLTLP